MSAAQHALGVQEEFQAIERAQRAKGAALNVPTYKAITASGAVEEHPHDETTLQTDEDRAAWAAYTAARQALNREINERTTRVLLLEGMVCGEPPAEWLAKQKRYGLDVPEDPDDRKLAYIETEILRTTDDIMQAAMRIQALSMTGIVEIDIEAAEAAFRGLVSRAIVGGDQAAARALGLQPAVPGGGNGQGVGQKTQ